MKLATFCSALVLLSASASALECMCTVCSGQPCTADICSSTVTTGLLTGTQYTLRCESDDTQCNTSSVLHTTLCCNNGDHCNVELQPQLNSPTEEMSTEQPTTGSGDQFPPPLEPGDKCFKSDSTEGEMVVLCPLEHSCFSTLRRLNNGTVASRRGCSQAPCIEETRGRKVKRCCSEHMCNVLLNVTEFFPDLISNTTEAIPTSEAPTDTSTPPSPTFIPPILTPLEPTTANPNPPSETPPGTVHCHCRGEECVANMVCTAQFACSIDYFIKDYSVVDSKRGCVDRAESCDALSPVPGSSESMYTSCCQEQLCNEIPNSLEVPAYLLSRPTETPDYELYYKLGAVAIAVLAVLIVAASVIAIVSVICVKQRRRKKFSPPQLPEVEPVRAGSVQSTTSSNGKGSATHLVSKV